MSFSHARRLRATWLAVAVALFVGGCAMLDRPTALDAEEGWQVYAAVKASGSLPEGIRLGRSQTRSKRILAVLGGLEDRAAQDRVLDAAREARRVHSSKPVVVIFYKGRRDKSEDLTPIRREVIP